MTARRAVSRALRAVPLFVDDDEVTEPFSPAEDIETAIRRYWPETEQTRPYGADELEPLRRQCVTYPSQRIADRRRGRARTMVR